MKLKNIFIYPLLAVLLICCNTKEGHVVKVSERQILVNNTPYVIKGFAIIQCQKGVLITGVLPL